MHSCVGSKNESELAKGNCEVFRFRHRDIFKVMDDGGENRDT